MPKHKLAQAMVGILVMPGLIFAGYPDVPRSHWAAPAVDKVGQSQFMTPRSDGNFHGGSPATRYEVAQAIARAMAEMENRLVAEGHQPQDIVPYIERINLYVADEIDHLKQSQKELRATVNELLERIERREAHSTPLPPPAPPMAHPHVSPTPHAETQERTEVRHEQRIHAVEGAATVNVTPAPTAISRIRARVSDGKIGAVEGSAPVAPIVDAAPAPMPVAKPKTIVSDEAAWEKSSTPARETSTPAPKTSAKAIEQLKEEEMKVEDEAVAADETQPDIGWSAESEAAKAAGKSAKTDKKATKPAPAQTSKKSAPRAAPVPLGAAPQVEMTHGAMLLPGEDPFGSDEVDASPKSTAKKAAKAPKAKAAPKATPAPITTASAATSVPMEAAEILDTPDIAATDGPSDEQLSNYQEGKASTSGGAATTSVASAAKASAKAVYTRSARAQSLLDELRNHRTK